MDASGIHSGTVNKDTDEVTKAGRAVYLQVNLDSLTHNINTLRARCTSNHTGVIGVVKAAAYGHGSIKVSEHLKKIGVERLAVATVDEAIHLRKNQIQGPIHIFGNAQSLEAYRCLQYNLIPTVSSEKAVIGMGKALRCLDDDNMDVMNIGSAFLQRDVPLGSINLKVDTGMSRNGCQPDELEKLMQTCQDEGVPVDAVFTHFADSWSNQEFTQRQLDTFLKVTDPYKSEGIKRHVANSGAILRGYGTNLDFIRPGIAMYGLPPDVANEEFKAFGLKPIASMVGYPTLIKRLPENRKVGYCGTYTTSKDEHIAVIPVGYADGYWRHLSNKGTVIRDKTGQRCPVVGLVSMDAITVSVPADTSLSDSFTLMSADYDPVTSASGIAQTVGSIGYEVGTRLSSRLPRVYTEGKQRVYVRALTSEIY